MDDFGFVCQGSRYSGGLFTFLPGPYRMINFTKAAEEKNTENLFIIKSKELAGIYIDNWKKHLAHSERYEPRY